MLPIMLDNIRAYKGKQSHLGRVEYIPGIGCFGKPPTCGLQANCEASAAPSPKIFRSEGG